MQLAQNMYRQVLKSFTQVSALLLELIMMGPYIVRLGPYIIVIVPTQNVLNNVKLTCECSEVMLQYVHNLHMLSPCLAA